MSDDKLVVDENSGVWTADEFAELLNDYFNGKGIGYIADKLNRKVTAIKDVLNDFPINRRGCIQKLAQAQRQDRTGKKWSRQERRYIVRLRKKLTTEEICTILWRTFEDVEKEIKRVVIQRPTTQRLFSDDR